VNLQINSCKKICSPLVPSEGCIVRNNGAVQNMRESVASSWETDPSEVVADGRSRRRRGRRRSLHSCKPLCDDAELVARYTPTSEDMSLGERNLHYWKMLLSRAMETTTGNTSL
jgi:hypothetical protein